MTYRIVARIPGSKCKVTSQSSNCCSTSLRGSRKVAASAALCAMRHAPGSLQPDAPTPIAAAVVSRTAPRSLGMGSASSRRISPGALHACLSLTRAGLLVGEVLLERAADLGPGTVEQHPLI